METEVFELSVTVDKLRTITDTIRHSMYLDMSELSKEEQEILLMNHTEHTNLYGILTDYVLSLESQIKSLEDKIN